MKHSIKRVQSQAGLSFAERKNVRPSVKQKLLCLLVLLLTATTGAWAQSVTTLADATAADVGKVVCAAGHLHTAKTAVPTGCTAVGILGKVTDTGQGLILALQDATSQTWNTINGWASVTTYAGTTLKLLPDATARGSLTSYTALGSTTVSDWAVAQKSDYEAIFINLGSTNGDSDGKTYDANVNAYITTGVGGTAISGDYWSATESSDDRAWVFSSYSWYYPLKTESHSVRPVLGFNAAAAVTAPITLTLASSDPEKGVVTVPGATPAVMEGEKQVGSGNETAPLPIVQPNWYSVSQQLYTSEEIGGKPGTIESIAYYATGAQTRYLEVYITATDRSVYNSKSDILPIREGVLVFEGNVNFVADDWTPITFKEPLEYNGKDNLAITIFDESGSSCSLLFRSFTTTGTQAAYLSSTVPHYNYQINNFNFMTKSGNKPIKSQILFNFASAPGGDAETSNTIDNGDGTYSVIPGSEITLKATASEGYHVTGWKVGETDVTEGVDYSDYLDAEGNLMPATSTVKLTIEKGATITAVFGENEYNVALAEGTEDAANWKAKSTNAAEVNLGTQPLSGVKKGATVTVTYSGSKKVLGVKAEKKAAAGIVNPVVGQVIGSDGKNYDADALLPTGVTAVAMIAYVGNGSDCTNGLAIQLNASPESKNWNDAKTYASGLTAVPGGTWRLPSKADWQNMFVGCAKSGDAISPDGNGVMNPIAGFMEKIGATGITWQSFSYWSSTDSGSDAWAVGVTLDDSDAFAEFGEGYTSNLCYVLACLAF